MSTQPDIDLSEPAPSRLRRWAAALGHGLRHPTLRGMAWGLAAVPVALLVYALALIPFTPSIADLRKAKAAKPSVVLSADGQELTVFSRANRDWVPLADISPHVVNALLSTEDARFYQHRGMDLRRTVGAAMNTVQGKVQGGSTLTQQLAKNLFLTSEKTVKRKMQEFFLAFWLERRFSKDEILTLYLNRVYFGAGAYGIDAASHRYFAKPARKLTLPEAAILAGLLKAPSHYAPTRNPADAGQRARLVIDAMLDAGFITSTQAQNAYRAPVRIGASQFAGAPYFVDFAIREAKALANGVDADLAIRSTYDPALQDAVEMGMIAGAAMAGLAPSIEIAAVIIDGEGAVKAMVGGRDYRISQFNRATHARRQPGSAFKPFVYLAAIEQGRDPLDFVEDAPVTIGKWSPENYKRQYFGEVTMTEALARSLNGATVRVQEEAGRGAVRLAAKRMGLKGPMTQGPALALGVDAVTPLELAAAYAPFANGGYRVEAHGVERIDLSDGEQVFQRASRYLDVAASPQGIRRMNEMLAAVADWGTGKAARLSRARAFGKTGTTQDNRDAWFVGHAGGLVCVVWVGRDDNGPMGEVTGGGAPAAIWREIMERALIARPPYGRADPLVAPVLAPVIVDAPEPAQG